jgi:glyoxylase-like metal-dependent hydrolase (beta-lactamase superfamily II)
VSVADACCLMHAESRTRRPTFCFLIKHPTAGQNIIWDLGIQQEREGNFSHPSLQSFDPHVEEDLSETLGRLGMAPTDIHKVMISRGSFEGFEAIRLISTDKHWDHTGNPLPYTKAQFYIGAGDARQMPLLQGPDFANRVVSLDWEETPGRPVAAFEHSLDVFGDGSVFIVDAYGHTPGHINLLVRTGRDEWVLLASDSCHHCALLASGPGEAKRGFGKYREYWEDESVPPAHSNYEDETAAEKHLLRIQACESHQDVLVVIAHDEVKWKRWFGGKKYGVGPDLRGWKGRGSGIKA